MDNPDNLSASPAPKAPRASKSKGPALPLTQALSPGRIALLQLIATFLDTPKAKLLAIPGVKESDLAYLSTNGLIQLWGPANYRATYNGKVVSARGW